MRQKRELKAKQRRRSSHKETPGEAHPKKRKIKAETPCPEPDLVKQVYISKRCSRMSVYRETKNPADFKDPEVTQ